MNSDVVIRVEGLGKRYTLGARSNERYTALRDVIADSARKLLRRNRASARDESTSDEFWALKDVSFEVKRGEVLGIIGRNGAGKSTLLKILSRITEPTQGRIRLRGRVASLLEVGTGFHPELTGRENIFLNGAILGMHRHEIKARFDEIVAFADVENFLDTPVKRYSSGMYVRLAFAVAAHLEPEILIVDEVLAVGDAEFQKKCLGKMQDASSGGKTVLLVSHNMGAVVRLCNRAIHLDKGRMMHIGDTDETINAYLDSGANSEGWIRPAGQRITPPIYLQEAHTSADGTNTQEFRFDQDISLVCHLFIRRPLGEAKICITVQDQFQHYISTTVKHLTHFPLSGEHLECELVVPKCFLAPNSYSFRVAVFEGPQQVFDVVDVVCSIKVTDNGSPMAAFDGINYGNVILPFRWETRLLSKLDRYPQ